MTIVCTYHMAIVIVLLPLLTITSLASQTPNAGLTGLDDLLQSQCVGRDLARIGSPEQAVSRAPEKPMPSAPTDNWILLDSWSDQVVIQADNHYAVYFDPSTHSLSNIGPQNDLDDTCWQAIEKAPRWLRDDLYDQLTRITYLYNRDLVAQLILDTPDPYVDEVAFCVAHISRQLAGGSYGMTSIFLENAQNIYEADTYLDYVNLVDHGNSNDDDYWTTVRYQVKTSEGDTVDVELDRDDYYWYIVHPRLSDEIPQYIQPSSGQYQPPPTGVFWRDYLFNHADAGYPVLREAMDGVGVLYSHMWNNGTPANGAVGCVTQWINDVMHWGAGAERPIQPVRIYTLHCGNCGEYSDITAAAARTCLIPSKCTMAFCNDHTWNEFWGERWLSWEPVNNYVGDSLAYYGWGHRFPAVFNYRGDGWTETITERYTMGQADLNVTVTDAMGTPMDGVKITLQSDAIFGGLYHCTSAITNCDGFATIKIGAERNIYLRLDSPIGGYPSSPGQVVQVVDNSVAGETYEWSHELSLVEIQMVMEAPDPPNPTDHYLMEISLGIRSEIGRAQIWSNSEFAKHMEPGMIDFAVMDGENFADFQAGSASYGFELGQHHGSGHVSFVMPTDDAWYAVFSNVDRVVDAQCVLVSVNLYVDSEFSVSPRGIAQKPDVFRLDQNYPNPFNPSTTISFSLPQAGHTSLSIYNLLGQEVVKLLDEIRPAGLQTIRFDGSNLASGTYFYRIEAGNYQDVKVMRLIK
jgi:hypothetical protein